MENRFLVPAAQMGQPIRLLNKADSLVCMGGVRKEEREGNEEK